MKNAKQLANLTNTKENISNQILQKSNPKLKKMNAKRKQNKKRVKKSNVYSKNKTTKKGENIHVSNKIKNKKSRLGWVGVAFVYISIAVITIKQVWMQTLPNIFAEVSIEV